ncbi:MAG: hypothetical protein ACLQE9_23400 [Roseiarcus sp.]
MAARLATDIPPNSGADYTALKIACRPYGDSLLDAQNSLIQAQQFPARRFREFI